jgi:hypothetical protein
VCKLKIKPPRSQFEYILSTSPSAVQPLSPSAPQPPSPSAVQQPYTISYIPYPLLFYPSPSAVQHSSKPYPLFLSYILIQAPQQFSNPKTSKPYPIFLSYFLYPLSFILLLFSNLLLITFIFLLYQYFLY